MVDGRVHRCRNQILSCPPAGYRGSGDRAAKKREGFGRGRSGKPDHAQLRRRNAYKPVMVGPLTYYYYYIPSEYNSRPG